jgi:hypothetical protein
MPSRAVLTRPTVTRALWCQFGVPEAPGGHRKAGGRGGGRGPAAPDAGSLEALPLPGRRAGDGAGVQVRQTVCLTFSPVCLSVYLPVCFSGLYVYLFVTLLVSLFVNLFSQPVQSVCS